jgi:hypothetical protein
VTSPHVGRPVPVIAARDIPYIRNANRPCQQPRRQALSSCRHDGAERDDLTLRAPDEAAAEAEVLITILPSSQGLHDVMIIPLQRAGTSLAGVVISAPRRG